MRMNAIVVGALQRILGRVKILFFLGISFSCAGKKVRAFCDFCTSIIA